MKLMIATPAYSNSVTSAYAISLSQTILLLNKNLVDVFPLITPSGSLLVAERNRLLEAFWQSDCTHMLCIDSDLGWPAEAVISMLAQNKDFIAGVYPARKLKNKFIFRPVTDQDGALVTENHLVKSEYIPAGFMLLTRNCIAKMRNKFPELYYSPKDPRAVTEESTYCLFDTEVYEGEFWGEDYVFCRRAREAGNEIWVDPLIQFDHAGQVGSLIDTFERCSQDLEKTTSMAA
jgi:hypothetical protein